MTYLRTMFLQLLLMLTLWAWCAWAGEPYQKFRGLKCEWCGSGDSILNKLNVAHFYNQSEYPAWKNVKLNTRTLCRRCHYVQHKRNWKRCVPEFCLLFGLTPDQIRAQCVKETGVNY